MKSKRYLALFLIFSLFWVCKKKPNENYLEVIKITNTADRTYPPSIAIDSKGRVHLVWTDEAPGYEQIFYAAKPKGGTWTEPINVSNTQSDARYPSIAVDREDRLHLAWQQWISDSLGWGWVIFYSYKPFEGNWSVPETVTRGYSEVVPQIAVDNSNNTHLIWVYGGYYQGIRYRVRRPDGTWTPETTLRERPQLIGERCLVIDSFGNVHLTYNHCTLDYLKSNIYYMTKPKDENWSETLNISNTDRATGSIGMVVDREGDVHIAWSDDKSHRAGSLYRMKRVDGEWARIDTLPKDTLTPYYPRLISFPEECLIIGPEDELFLPAHVVPDKKDEKKILVPYIVKPRGEDWSDVIIAGILPDTISTWFQAAAVDDEGTIFIINEDKEVIEYKPNRR